MKTLKHIGIFTLIIAIGISLLSLLFFQKINALILLCTAFFHLTMGILILRANKKNPTNIAFFLFCFGFFLWIFSYGIYFLFEKEAIQLFIARTATVPGIIFSIIFVYLARNFPIKEYKLTKKYIITHLIIFLIIFSTVYSKYYINNVQGTSFSFGFMYPLAMLYVFIMLFWGALILLLKAFRLQGELKIQVQLLGFGCLLSFVNAIFFTLILPGIGISQFNILSPVGTIFLVIFWAIAIVKYRLMEITVIIKKSIANSIIGLLVIISIGGTYYYTHENPMLSLIILLSLSLFWAYAAFPLQKSLITTAKRAFIKGYYDTNKLLIKITELISELNQREEIFKTIEEELFTEIELEKTALILADQGHDGKLRQYVYLESEIKSDHNKKEFLSKVISSETISLNTDIIKFFKNKTNFIELTDLDEKIATYFLSKGFNKKCVILPFHSPENLEGLVVLGERSNQVNFKKEDFDFFKMLINNTNALLYRLTPYEVIEKQFQENQKKLFDTEIQLIRSKKIESIVHATRQCQHEMRTPLSIIRMSLKKIPESSAEIIKLKKSLVEEIDRAVEISKETLILTDGGTRTPQFRLVDLNKTIERSIKLVPQNKPYTINLNLTPLPKILVIEEDIEILFTNLMNNSLEAIGENGGIITIATSQTANDLVIKFSDTGKGIPDKLKTRVWEPYVSGTPTDTGNSNAGRGWGLTIVNRIIQDHSGTITLESEVGKGTTFTIKLPIKR